MKIIAQIIASVVATFVVAFISASFHGGSVTNGDIFRGVIFGGSIAWGIVGALFKDESTSKNERVPENQRKDDIQSDSAPQIQVTPSPKTPEEIERQKEIDAEKAMLREIESKKKSRQSWGWIMAISGGLSTLIGSCFFLSLLLAIIDPATFSKTSETPVTISTFLCCPLPVLLIGGALIFFGIRIIRSGKNL